MRKRNLATLEKFNIPKLPFWNGELEFLLERRHENRYFREFFLHICNYATKEELILVFETDVRLQILMANNYCRIFNRREERLVTRFAYEVANAVMAMQGWDASDLKNPGEFYADDFDDQLEKAYSEWYFRKNGLRCKST